MLKCSLRLYQAATPISKTEFVNAISRVFPEVLQDGKHKMGLAVSGGVDSMALAVMCREYLPREKTELHALVVDHGLRPTSNHEAQGTAHTLTSRLSIKSHVLKLNLRFAKALETRARIARFDALTRCCSKQGIRHVFMAHHEDDQYENILYRLSLGGRSSLGMRSHGLLQKSTHFMPSQGPNAMWDMPSVMQWDSYGVDGVPDLHLSLLRPLLGFSKDRLVATCKAFEVPWVEDETNKDPRLTPRNAIRHIFANHRLPTALSKSSLLAVHQRGQYRLEAINTIARHLFEVTPIQLDLRVASAIITPPNLEDLSQKLPNVASLATHLSGNSLPAVVGSYIQHLALLVNATADTILSAPQDTLDLFAEPSERKKFVHDGTIFDPLPDGRWLLYSAPPSKSKHRQSSRLYNLHVPLGISEGKGFLPFDYRWWLSVWSPAPSQKFYVRNLQSALLARLQARLAAGEITMRDKDDAFKTPRDLDSILRSLGPYHLRFNIPCIVTCTPAQEKLLSGLTHAEERTRSALMDDPDVETIVAVPTLNLRIHPTKKGMAPWWIEGLDWKCWYKHLKWMDGRLDESVVRPEALEMRGLGTGEPKTGNKEKWKKKALWPPRIRPSTTTEGGAVSERLLRDSEADGKS